MSKKIIIDKEVSDAPSQEVLNDDSHQLKTEVDINNRDIYMEFTSRESMRAYALSLLHESEFGTGEVELYPLVDSGGKRHVVNGVRLSENSSRVFISYPNEKST